MHQSSFSIVSRFRELVERHFSERPLRLLDVGSYGVNGTYKEIFADPAKFLYTGLDVNPGPNVDYVPADPYVWPELKDETFDVIISGQAFEHIEFPWLVIEEMKRTLKKDGLICIVAPSRGPEHKYPVDCWRYYPDGFRALAKWAGMDVLESKTCWGTSGFSDGSDQWGDTFCILHKKDDNRPLRMTKQPAHLSDQKTASNFNNPLRLGKNGAYYGFAREEVIQVILKHNIPAKRVLEIGCAGGATGKRVKEISTVEKYVGIELSKQAAQLARQHLDHVIVGDVESMDLASELGMAGGNFDLVLALDVLEHMNNPWDVLASLAEYLNPGGHVIASIPNVQNISVVQELLQGRWQYRDAGILDATHLRFFTLHEIPPMFSGAGLRMLSAQRILNPRIDPDALREKGNAFMLGKIHIRDLSREEMLNLYTYQYIAIAQKPKSVSIGGCNIKEVKQGSAESDGSEKLLLKKGLTSIVILTFNQLQYTKECYESIKRHTPELHEIIFIDNGSKDGTVKWLLDAAKEDSTIRVIENHENLGFAKGCNQGIEAAKGEFILLLNNDVVVTEGWLSGLLECHKYAPNAGIIGPMTNSISGIQRIDDPAYARKSLDGYAAAFREKYRHRRIPLRRIVGFCMLFRKELTEKIGLIDEAFGTGNFEDDDYCLRAELEGYKNYIAGDVFIHHYGSQSFIGNKINYSAAMGSNRNIFNEKWSGIDQKTLPGKKLLALKIMEKSDDLYQKNRLDEAVKFFMAGIKEYPENYLLYISAAEKLIDSKQFQNAMDLLNSMPSSNENIRATALKGYCDEGLDHLDNAKKYAEQALSLGQDCPLAVNLMGILNYRAGDISAAEKWFEQALAADPGYGEPYTNLGLLKWTAGDQDEGIKLLEHGFRMSPTAHDIATHYYSAVTALEVYERGASAFRGALTFYPNNQSMAFLLIDLLLKQGKYEEAMEIVEAAIIRFGTGDNNMLAAAMAIREKTGPREIGENIKKPVSLCMIVKNEEKYLAQSLFSVRDIADEMIVVDTGSTDRTKDIATIFGARVYDFVWNDDFSAARNFSLDHAKGAWILVLDGDEIISACDIPKLSALLGSGPARNRAYSLITRNYVRNIVANWTENKGEYQEERGSGWHPSVKVRIFPNSPAIRFRNPVHELVEPSLAAKKIQIMPCDVPVHHYGKLDAERSAQRWEQYFNLGRKKLLEGNEDPNAIRELAIQANELGKYEDAVDLWARLIAKDPKDQQAYTNIVRSYAELRRLNEALEAAEKAVALDPLKREAVYHYGLVLFYLGRYDRIIEEFVKFRKHDAEYPPVAALLALAYLLGNKKQDGVALMAELRKRGFAISEYIALESEKLTYFDRHGEAKRLIETATESGYTGRELSGVRTDDPAGKKE